MRIRPSKPRPATQTTYTAIDNGARCIVCGAIVYNTPKWLQSARWQCVDCSKSKQLKVPEFDQKAGKLQWTYRRQPGQTDTPTT